MGIGRWASAPHVEPVVGTIGSNHAKIDQERFHGIEVWHLKAWI
jgi:hypothetical protein